MNDETLPDSTKPLANETQQRGPLKGFKNSQSLQPSVSDPPVPKSPTLPPDLTQLNLSPSEKHKINKNLSPPNFFANEPTNQISEIAIFYFRILSLVFLYFAISVWLNLLGYWQNHSQGDDVFFDYLSLGLNDKIYIVFSAVLYPIIGVGLWSGLSWGRVVWYLGACLQCGVFFYGFALSSFVPFHFIFHIGSVAFYLLCLLSFFYWRKKHDIE